ncbi:Lacal_2735 family protein [uncultured Lacinutrix sp.]|uniref:Lacal_2735 family protein n=1 Tax=uncultured Lacinutrix sp. TaxID=574032 RepID=UPI00345C0926
MMFGLFKTKSKLDKLHEEYKKLLEESYKLSTKNRTESDIKQAEAQAILDQIEVLQQS